MTTSRPHPAKPGSTAKSAVVKPANTKPKLANKDIAQQQKGTSQPPSANTMTAKLPMADAAKSSAPVVPSILPAPPVIMPMGSNMHRVSSRPLPTPTTAKPRAIATQVSLPPGIVSPAEVATGEEIKPKLQVFDTKNLSKEQRREIFRNHAFPYDQRLSERDYQELAVPLQIELLKMQKWVKNTGQRVVIVFEGRDAAGKGGHH